MARHLTIDEQIILNQFSQDLFTLEEMDCWFEKYNLQNKREIVINLFFMVVQAHPTFSEIEESAKSIKKLKSPAAVKFLNRGKPFEKYGYEVCNLPENELLIAFEILLLTLKKADGRRKAQEKPDACNHWWHKDLSNENYLQKLRE